MSFEFETSSFELKTSSFELKTSSFEFETSSFKLKTLSFEFKTSSIESKIFHSLILTRRRKMKIEMNSYIFGSHQSAPSNEMSFKWKYGIFAHKVLWEN